MVDIELIKQLVVSVFAGIGAIGVADVLIFKGKIGVLFGEKFASLIGRK